MDGDPLHKCFRKKCASNNVSIDAQAVVVKSFQPSPGMGSKVFACDIDHSYSVVVPALGPQTSIYPSMIQNTEGIGRKGDVTSFSETFISQFVDLARDRLLSQE